MNNNFAEIALEFDALLTKELLPYCKNNDSINDVCDAIDDFTKNIEKQPWNPPKEFTVDIGEKYIKQGVKWDACNCPIALAIKDQLKVDYAKVGLVIFVEKTGACYKPKDEIAYSNFILCFDNSGNPKPITLTFIKN